MSLRRAIKAEGLGNFLKLGFALATSQKVTAAPKPQNEALRVARVNDTGLIGRDVSRQFEIFAEIAKTILGCETAMVNLLDGACQYTIGAVGKGYDPLLGVPQEMTFCQYALLSPEHLVLLAACSACSQRLCHRSCQGLLVAGCCCRHTGGSVGGTCPAGPPQGLRLRRSPPSSTCPHARTLGLDRSQGSARRQATRARCDHGRPQAHL